MAKQNRTTLKGYFETGDIPSQAQYADLIDSNLNLAETGIQIIPGTVSSSIFESSNNIIVGTNITASGNISSSGHISSSALNTGIISALAVILLNVTLLVVTFESVDTGQGANELFAMNQNVTTTSNVTFNNITANANISSSGGTGSFGSLLVDGSSIDFSGLPTSDPSISGRLYNDSGTVKVSAG